MRKITPIALVLLTAIGFVFLPEMIQGYSVLRVSLNKVASQLLERKAEPTPKPEKTSETSEKVPWWSFLKRKTTPPKTDASAPPSPLDTLPPNAEKKAPKHSLQDRINAPIGQHTWRYYDDLAKELTQMEDPNQDKKLMATINKLKKLIILKEEYCQAINFNEKVREKRKTKETFAALLTKIGYEMKACVHSGLLSKQQITEIEKFVIEPNCP